MHINIPQVGKYCAYFILMLCFQYNYTFAVEEFAAKRIRPTVPTEGASEWLLHLAKTTATTLNSFCCVLSLKLHYGIDDGVNISEALLTFSSSSVLMRTFLFRVKGKSHLDGLSVPVSCYTLPAFLFICLCVGHNQLPTWTQYYQSASMGSHM